MIAVTLFPDLLPEAPPGFRLLDDVVAPDEEATLLAWASAQALEPYVMHDTPSRRRVAPFGATYNLGQRGVNAPPIPDVLRPLIGRAAPLAGLDPGEVVQALVTRYPVGAGIGWHRDKPIYGPTVLGVSLGGACRFRLRPRERPRDVVTVHLPPRSVYVMSGPARDAWEHAIPPVTAERWSITLRTLRAP
jgi:alkylated DNA repair dioxygenase AlkB